MGASGTQSTVTQAADPWYKAEARDLYNNGTALLNRNPYSAYPGSTVAGFQPMQLAAQDYLSRAFLGQSVPYQAPQMGGPYGSPGNYFGGYTPNPNPTPNPPPPNPNPVEPVPQLAPWAQTTTSDPSSFGAPSYLGYTGVVPGTDINLDQLNQQLAQRGMIAGMGSTSFHIFQPGQQMRTLENRETLGADLQKMLGELGVSYQPNAGAAPRATAEQQELERVQRLLAGGSTAQAMPQWDPSQGPWDPTKGAPSWYDPRYSAGPSSAASQQEFEQQQADYIEYMNRAGVRDPVTGGNTQETPVGQSPVFGPVDPFWNRPTTPPPPGTLPPGTPPGYPPGTPPRGPFQPPATPPSLGGLGGAGTGIGEAQQAAAVARMIANGGAYPMINPMMASGMNIGASPAGWRGDVFAQQVTPWQMGGVQNLSPERIAAGQAAAERVGRDQVGAERVAPTLVGAERVAAERAAAERIGAGSVASRDVAGGNLLGGIGMYRDPYENQVVGQALSDIDRARQLAQGQNASMATLSGAFGGDRHAILEAETNRSFAEQAARTASQLRSQGFERAAGLAQQDAQRALAAGQSNQGAALQAALANQGAGLEAGRANQDAALRAAFANQSAGLQAGGMNQDAQMRASLANQAAGLQAGGMNQDAALRAGLANQATGLQAGTANQDAALRASLANQAAGLQAGTANQAAGLQAGLANQSTQRSIAETNARFGMDAQMANQAAQVQTQLANQGRFQELQQFNASLGLSAAQANQATSTQIQLANQQAGLQGQTANQAAWFQGRNQQLQGAGLLSSFGGDVFNRTLGVGSALSGIGAEQQGQAQDTIGADYAQWLEAQNDPYRRFGFLSGMLTGVPQGQTTTSYVPGNRGAGFGGGALAGAGVGSMFGPWGAGIGAGIGGLLGLF